MLRAVNSLQPILGQEMHLGEGELAVTLGFLLAEPPIRQRREGGK